MLAKLSIVIYLLLTSASILAQNNSISTISDNTEGKLELVTGLPKPPFIIDTNGNGLQLDLIRAALPTHDKSIHFSSMPLGRNITAFQWLNADGIITIPSDYQHPALFISKPYISYQNVAISLMDNNFNIKSVEDLSDKSIAAFQNAKKFLGKEFKKAVDYSIDYREVANQAEQIKRLYLRETEVIVLEINIFKYFIKQQTEAWYNKPFNVHYIFKEQQYSAGFKSKKLRNKFDIGIQAIKENGNYQTIVDSYLN